MATIARPRKPAVPPPGTALPGDVRLTHIATAVVALLGALLAAAALLQWAARSSWFEIRAIRFDGALQRTSAVGLREQVAPQIAGNFFALDLPRARQAFEAVPWVRRATVRRVWPDRLVVRVEEHHAAALWLGDDRLVNSHGEVFAVSTAEVDEQQLPALAGPDGSAAPMLAMLHRLAPLFGPQAGAVEQLHLSARGSWRVLLVNGITVELGRGSEDEVVARATRFAATVGEVTAHYGHALEYADLRHADGYAVRLRDLTPVPPSGPTGP